MDLDLSKLTQPVADVANNLIDKIEKACGFLFILWQQSAKNQAKAIYIGEIKARGDLEPMEKYALITHCKKINKEYTKQTDILAKAISMFNGEEKPNQISDDWLSLYMDKIKNISDEEIQKIWANILLSECRNPNSVSVQALNSLVNITKKEAEQLTKIFKRVVYDPSYPNLCAYPVIFMESREMDDLEMRVEDFFDLESLGFIRINVLPNYTLDFADDKIGKNLELKFGGKKFNIRMGIASLNLGKIFLTAAGRNLYNALEFEVEEDYLIERCTAMWEEQGHIVTIT